MAGGRARRSAGSPVPAMSVTWLTRIAWTDADGGLHIDVPRLLDELGVPDTPETREEATRLAAKILGEMLKDTPAVIKVTE